MKDVIKLHEFQRGGLTIVFAPGVKPVSVNGEGQDQSRIAFFGIQKRQGGINAPTAVHPTAWMPDHGETREFLRSVRPRKA